MNRGGKAGKRTLPIFSRVSNIVFKLIPLRACAARRPLPYGVPGVYGGVYVLYSNFAVLQAGRAELCAVAAALSEPLCAQECAYTQYVRNCLASHRAEDVMALVEAAPNDIARRFKNLHHKLSH